MFELKTTEENRVFTAFCITAVWGLSLIPLALIGVGDSVIPGVPELIYIGIPISFFIYLCLLTWCFKYLCYTGGLFRKDTKYWKTWPIAFWAIKCTLEAISVGIVIVLSTMPVLLSGIPTLALKVVRSVGVVFTKPDGLALDQIKEIWRVNTDD